MEFSLAAMTKYLVTGGKGWRDTLQQGPEVLGQQTVRQTCVICFPQLPRAL